MKFETKAIRLQTERSQHREHATPMFNTSSFVFDDAEQMRAMFADEIEGNIYSRYSNPTTREFELKMAALEGVDDAFATASGMAAIYAGLMGLLEAGDHILASRAVFGSTHGILSQVLPKCGISCTMVAADQPEAWSAAIRPETKMLFIETPSNPGLAIIDLEWAGKFAKEHQLIFHVDNCFATPYIQNPAAYGADLVTHSATKFIDGQGRVVGGVVTGREDLIAEVRKFCRKTGPCMAPFNAWVLSKSLETLHVRLDRHCSNALELATRLQDHPQVEQVNYPFLPSHPQYQIAQKQMKLGGGLVTFRIKGGLEKGKQFLDAIKMCSLSANLGDSRTIVTHPASTTHAKLKEEDRQAVGITAGLIRVSVGLEHIDDIAADIFQALG
ncbi:MAG: aminotransferase class V-fold PLP-dependent enzyme [Bacteroidota bacterium]